VLKKRNLFLLREQDLGRKAAKLKNGTSFVMKGVSKRDHFMLYFNFVLSFILKTIKNNNNK
jgi:hypothetical protein